MGRPKLPTSSAEISAEISRVQQETQAHVRQLEERRRLAETRENERRGQLILDYLSGERGTELRHILTQIAEPEDVMLFSTDQRRERSP